MKNFQKSFLLFIFLSSNFLQANLKKIFFYGEDWGREIFVQRIFQSGEYLADSNRDNVKLHFFKLKEKLKKLGYYVEVLSPEQIANLNENDFEFLVFFNIRPEHHYLTYKFSKEKLISYLWEPPLVHPYDYNPQFHQNFSKVFTILDDLVDNKKYFKFHEVQPTFKFKGDGIPFEQRKLCTMMTGNKDSNDPNSLYPKRREIINFFEKQNTNEFEFYGFEWNKNEYKTYKGYAWSKLETYSKYKFTVCYENSKDLNGYITSSKIFFAFIAGSIPIYWRSANVDKYIPENCYIDGSKFRNVQELYEFMKNFTKDKYDEYIKNIKKYLKDKRAFLFSWENFVDIFCKNIIPNYDRSQIFNENQVEKLKSSNNEI